jgi:hypothetical protein
MQQADVAQHHAASSLVLERNGAGDERAWLEIAITRSDDRELRLGEHDGKWCSPETRANVGKARGVLAGDPALVGRLVQQRQIIAGIARDEDGAVAALHRVAVEQGHAARVPRERRVLEREPAHVRRASGGGDHVVDVGCALDAVLAAIANSHAVAFALDRQNFGVRLELQLALERAPRVRSQRRIAERPDMAEPAEKRDVDAEPMERLPELEPDHAGAEDGDGARQIVPAEDVVIDDEAIAGATQHGRQPRRGAGGDDRPRELDRRVIVDRERPVVDEARVSAHVIRFGDCVDDHPARSPTKRSRSRFTRPITALPSTWRSPSRRRPNSGQRSTPCAASAAAMSSLLGMQPTRAQVVPYGPPSIRTVFLPAATAAR